MYDQGYDDACANLMPNHLEDEEYMRGYADAESGMEDNDCDDEPVEDFD